MEPLRVWFDRGTLRLDGNASVLASLPGVAWDPGIDGWRAPAHRYADVLYAARQHAIDDQVAAARSPCAGEWITPSLRPYQEHALSAWFAFDRRGIVCMPTGSGKTRVALAALAALAKSALVLCPTRALLSDWVRTLSYWYGGRVGVVGDGEHRIEPVTAMTFESAARHIADVGAFFATIVIDEVHHFAGGARAEMLEMVPAVARLGLTAIAPRAASPASEPLAELVGPVVCEVSMTSLLGTHLAKLETVHLKVLLDDAERSAYLREYRPFADIYAAFVRAYPGAQWAAFVESVSRTAAGRRVLQGYQRATRIAAFPNAKRELVGSLLARHRSDKTLVFTAFAEDAYAIGRRELVPVITADVGRSERERILRGFRDGSYRAIVSARVLSEGIDVPDANVAILVGGSLGGREYVQRVGRILRPGPGKEALAYELVTAGTIDDSRARARRKRLAAA
jgi:superfamily II DNA or RNA helicase